MMESSARSTLASSSKGWKWRRSILGGVRRRGDGRGAGPRTPDDAGSRALLRGRRDPHVMARGARRGIGLGWVSILEPDVVVEALDVPPAWTLVAYLCLGWPVEEHLDPELERAGWQARARSGGSRAVPMTRLPDRPVGANHGARLISAATQSNSEGAVTARIYKPAKSAMQSGTARTKEWVVEHEPAVPREIDPLMGWTSSADTRAQVPPRIRHEGRSDRLRRKERPRLSPRRAEPARPHPQDLRRLLQVRPHRRLDALSLQMPSEGLEVPAGSARLERRRLQQPRRAESPTPHSALPGMPRRGRDAPRPEPCPSTDAGFSSRG